MGSFVALDLVLFFLFFELTLVPGYFLIGGWGFARRGYAAIKFFVYTFAGSAFLLVGILAVAFLHQSQTGVLTFQLPVLSRPTSRVPRACCSSSPSPRPSRSRRRSSPSTPGRRTPTPKRPTAGSVILVAIMAKLGTYGIVRFDLNLFPQASRTLAPLLLTLAVDRHPLRRGGRLRAA